MKKEEYKELMLLSMTGELSDAEQAKLDAYMKKHPEVKKERKEVEKFRSFIEEHSSTRTSDDLLISARGQLREALRHERMKESWSVSVSTYFREILQPKFALSGAGILSLGMLIGYCSFSPTGREDEMAVHRILGASETKPRTSISNIRFIDSDASDGEVEFEFDAVAPMHVKGKIDDPEIQKLLTHALLNESNAGVRLSTVNAIRYHSENRRMADPAIKSALISSLKSDVNPGVRREALTALQQYEFDEEIRDALLFALSNDGNSGIRVAAINALEITKMDGTTFDEGTINALRRQIEKEQNNYIRNRAVNLVREVYQ